MNCTVTEEEAGWLRKFKQKIEAAHAELSDAESQRGRVLARLNDDEMQLNIKFMRLDPEDAASIASIAAERARIGVLRDWCNNAPKIRASITKLAGELRAAAPSMRTAAQTRSTEEFHIAQGSWNFELDRLFVTPELVNQVANLRRVAQAALSELGVLLQARRAAPLTREELESGNLRDGSVVVRRLTFDERQTGLAAA